MTIKTTVTDKDKQKESSYPRIMRVVETGILVLFQSHTSGTVVHTTDHRYALPVGHYSTSWNMSFFEPFHGSVTIEQE